MTRAPLSQLNDWELVPGEADIRGWELRDEAGNPIGRVAELIVNTETEYVDTIILDTGAEIPADAIAIGDGIVYLRCSEPVELEEPERPVELEEPERPVEPTSLRQAEEAVVPVIEEDVQIGKHAVERGGIRIHQHVSEQPVSEQVTLRDETVDVERRLVDRPASEADLAAMQQGTFEVREHDEEAVVQKQAQVVEEVLIDKDVQERTETVRDTVRRTDVDVTQLRDRERGS